MEKFYLKGELLQLHTKNDEVVQGRFHGMNCDKSRISLYSVKELPSGDMSDGICHYYDSEVREIVKIKDSEEIVDSVKKHLLISQKECENIIKLSKKYIFINHVDNSYHEALEDLKHYSYVAVSTDGASMGRKCKMPFLVMSTPHQIYIFDTQVMQYYAFEAGLKGILEGESPKKIVHDCRKLSDCLYHKHNVELKSVFDTQVGDLLVTKNKIGRLPSAVKSLQQCLNTYLGLPLNTIDEQLNIVQCNERPLATDIKDTIAKNIAYLQRLSEVLSHEMELPFIRGVECYIENLRSCDDFKAWELCGKLEEAPKEFKNSIEY